MKKLLFILALLCVCLGSPRSARADAQTTGACPTPRLGAGVTCVQFGLYDSFPSAPKTSVTLNFTPSNHNNGFFVGGYTCFAPVSGGGCNTAATAATLSLADNINPDGESCFAISPGSPFNFVFQGTTIQKNYMWYCPGLPNGVNSITMKCSVTNGCALTSFWIAELSGMCNTAPCWDVDAFGQSATGVNAVTLTTPKINYSNEFIGALFQNISDEVYTPAGGTIALQSSSSLTNQLGNMLAGNTQTTAGNAYTLGGTWTGAADQGYGVIGAIKSASSSGAYRPARNRALSRIGIVVGCTLALVVFVYVIDLLILPSH